MNAIRTRVIAVCAGFLLAASAPALAQTTVGGTGIVPDRTAGEREFTLGGAGATNMDFDDSLGGVNFSYGWYSTPTQLWVIRQTINYANPSSGGQSWNGATRIGFDQHFTTTGPMRPFVGVTAGGVYGDRVSDSWTAGIEAGLKYYVHSRTFVYAVAEYAWLFNKADQLEDTFDDGQINWSIGIGFNF